MASMIQNLLMVEVSYQIKNLAQIFQPRNIAKSSLNYHKSNALLKGSDAIGHDRGHMRTQFVKG